jgi:hypothetical protein
MTPLTLAQQQALARVVGSADRMFEALEDLAEAGGLLGLAGRVRPGAIDNVRVSLRSVRQAIDEQLARPGSEVPTPAAPHPHALRRPNYLRAGVLGGRGPKGGRVRRS